MKYYSKCFAFLAMALLLLGGCSYLELSYPDGDGSIDVDSGAFDKVSSGESYYYFDELISLSTQQDRIFVKFTDAEASARFMDEIYTGISALALDRANRSDENSDALVLQVAGGMRQAKGSLQRLAASEDVRYASFVYDYQGADVAVSDVFAVKLKEGASPSALEALSLKYGCETVRRGEFGDGVFFVQIPKGSEYNTLDLSRAFFKTGLFEFAAPDFISFNAFQSNDPLFVSQWGLKNTGQYPGYPKYDIDIESAWEITQGSRDIVVAVLDDGVEMSHPDLARNIVPGYDAVLGEAGGNPVSIRDDHGTSVAGIIAAVKDNGIGISGVAPNCKLLPVRVGEDIYISHSAAASGINWAWNNGADVINCSWGGGTPNTLLTAEISRATTMGRNGKGCVVVFASGTTVGGDHVGVSYPASLYYVLAVGAMSREGKRQSLSSPDGTWSSNYGRTLDVIAPGDAIATTDRSGVLGYDISSAYFDKFWGTSAAAPHAAGVAALILSKYPELDQAAVRRAIEWGCTRLSSYTYSEDNEYPPLLWNNEVGYGLLNAESALVRAGLLETQRKLDNEPGLDFTIQNSSSYKLEDVIIDIWGNVNGEHIRLASSDILGGIEPGKQAGYPAYRGYDVGPVSTGAITDVYVELFACCPDYSGNLEVGVAIDEPTPNSYVNFAFGIGETFEKTIPDVNILNRPRVYIRIFDLPNRD